MELLNNIQQNQQDANTDYNNYTVSYLESKYDTKNRKTLLVDIGLLCNSIETQFSFDIVQYWNTSLNINECFDNANKYINNQKWKEDERIQNPTGTGSGIQIQSGVSMRSCNTEHFFEKNVNYFIEQQVPENTANLINDFSQLNIPAQTVVEFFGYFCPDVSDTYTFCVSNHTSITVWINSDHALYDYTFMNADISSKTTKKTQTYLFKNELYAFRIQISNTTTEPITEKLFWIEPNNGTNIIYKNTDAHQYFISLIQNNQLYKKQILYFGVVQNKEKPELYDCFFVNPIANNYNAIQLMKMNPKILYGYATIPTQITFSGSGVSTKPEGTSTNINVPNGIKLNINNAQYGVGGNHNTIVFEKTTSIRNEYKPANSSISPNLPNTKINTQNHYEETPYTKTIAVQKSIPSFYDVSSKVKPLVNENSLSIDGNYNKQFGDPYYGRSKNLNVNYSYSQNLANVTNKNLYISTDGELLLGYTFNGIEYSTPFEMDKYPPKIKNCNYTIKLSDFGILEVLDENNKIIGNKNLFKYIKNTLITDCMPNPLWIENPFFSKQIKVSEKIPLTVNNLVSSNGLFSLGFHNNEFVLHFCKNPEKKTGDYYYTDTSNLDNNSNQIFYFYRSLIRGIDGKKFLVQKNKTDNTGVAYYVPNSLKNILSVRDYTQIDGAMPLELNNYTKLSVPDENNCKIKCLNNCNHYFYQQSANGNLCYLDNTNNSNPLYSGHSNTNSKLKQKQFKIITTCKDNHSDQILPGSYNDFKTVGIQYSSVEDDPSKTYNCGLQQTQTYNLQNKNLIQKLEGFETINQNIADLTSQQTDFKNLQNQINNKYQSTTNLLLQHTDLSGNLQNQPYRFFNSAENIIPDIFKITPTPINTTTSLNDARIQDLNITLLEQNNLYTISAISMATVLLVAIFLAKD